MKRQDDKLIARYLDGAASSAERARVEERLRDNASFRQALERADTLVQDLAKLPQHGPTTDLVTAAQRAAAVHQRPRALRPWMLIPAATVGALLMLLVWKLMPSDVAITPSRARLVASNIQGEVWLTEGDTKRAPITGDVIVSRQRLATESGGQLTLALGKETRIDIDETTSLEIIDNDPQKPAALLERGVIRVVLGSSAQIETRFRGALHSVEVRFGSAGLLHDGKGNTTVACEKGETILHDSGQTISIPSGMELSVRDGVVTELRSIPDKLDVKVDPLIAKGERLAFSGQTNPGVILSINGEPVAVDEQGRFTHRLEVDKPKGRVRLTARDATWRRHHRELRYRSKAVTEDPAIETEWQWE